MLDDVKFNDYDFLGITPHLVQTDGRYGLWALPAMDAIYKLTGEQNGLLNWLKNPLKYISDELPKAIDGTLDNLATVHKLEER